MLWSALQFDGRFNDPKHCGSIPGMASGAVASFHRPGLKKLIDVLLPSNSSMKETPRSSSPYRMPRFTASATAVVCATPGRICANSPVNEKFDMVLVCSNGTRSMARVSQGVSHRPLASNPITVLLMGSSPMGILSCIGLSFCVKMVEPKVTSGFTLYCARSPANVVC